VCVAAAIVMRTCSIDYQLDMSNLIQLPSAFYTTQSKNSFNTNEFGDKTIVNTGKIPINYLDNISLIISKDKE
jgi:hypothetical protein